MYGQNNIQCFFLNKRSLPIEHGTVANRNTSIVSNTWFFLKKRKPLMLALVKDMEDCDVLQVKTCHI